MMQKTSLATGPRRCFPTVHFRPRINNDEQLRGPPRPRIPKPKGQSGATEKDKIRQMRWSKGPKP